MTKGRAFGAKLYLEGMEVPFIGATITFTVDQASIAYIDLVPHQSINTIKPRTKVDLEVRDYMDAEGGYPFVHAWSGEVFGYQFGKTPTSRTFTISCIDESGYWDNVLAYFFNSQQGLGKAGSYVSQTGFEQLDAKAQGIPWIPVSYGLTPFFKTKIDEVLADSKKDFLDAIVEIYKSIARISPFYDTAETRFRITEKILLNSSGKLRDLVNQAQGQQWFLGILNQNSGYSTLRMVLQDLLGIIFHDFVPAPFPAAVETDKLKGDPLKTSTNIKRTIGQFLFKPNLYMMPPPACNIYFPDEYSSFQFSRNFFKEPTRMIYRPELPRFSGGSVALDHFYEPPAFDNFMLRQKGWKDFKGTGDTQVSGAEFDDDSFLFSKKATAEKPLNDTLREQDFMTNEEKIRGIWMAQETMVPATHQFRASLDDSFRNDVLRKVTKYLFYKKRFQDRSLQITSHLKMSVLPGFTVLLLDDSDAAQNVVAYCSSVTHRIYATEGGYTNVTLSYARTVDEEDTASGGGAEPLVPPWFDEAVFGGTKAGKVFSTGKLTGFYADLIGARGCTSLLDLYDNAASMSDAVNALIDDYRQHKGSDSSRQAFIDQITRREYVPTKDAFGFIGATTETKDVAKETFTVFDGDKLAGSGLTAADAIQSKRDVIMNYRTALKTYRGFRG